MSQKLSLCVYSGRGWWVVGSRWGTGQLSLEVTVGTPSIPTSLCLLCLFMTFPLAVLAGKIVKSRLTDHGTRKGLQKLPVKLAKHCKSTVIQ